jgi:hypothetical protein
MYIQVYTKAIKIKQQRNNNIIYEIDILLLRLLIHNFFYVFIHNLLFI